MADLMGNTLAAGAQAAANAPDPGPALHQGMQAGLQLAQQKAQIAQFGIEMEFKKNQLEESKRMHVLDGMERAKQLMADNPAAGAQVLSGVYDVGVKLAMFPQMSPEQKNLVFKQNKELTDQIFTKAVTAYRAGDKAGQQAALADIGKLSSADQISLFHMVDSAVKPDTPILSAEALGGGKMKQQDHAAALKEINDWRMSGQIPLNVIQRAIANPGDVAAMGEGRALYAPIAEKKAALERQVKEQGIESSQASIKNAKAHLELSTRAEAGKATQEVYAEIAPELKFKKNVLGVRTFFEPGTGLKKFNLGIAALDKLVTDTGRLSASVYNGSKVTNKLVELKAAVNGWIPGRGADSEVPPSLLKPYNAIITALDKANNQNLMVLSKSRLAAAVDQGRITQESADTVVKGITTSGEEYLNKIGMAPAAPAAQPSPQPSPQANAGGKKAPSAAFLQGVMARPDVGNDPAKARAFLDKFNFDSSGVK